jgi:hypothetical protein
MHWKKQRKCLVQRKKNQKKKINFNSLFIKKCEQQLEEHQQYDLVRKQQDEHLFLHKFGLQKKAEFYNHQLNLQQMNLDMV